MEYNYRLSKTAYKDLDEIYRYIAVKLANRPAATAFKVRLENAISRLRQFPESGQLIQSYMISLGNIRKVIIGNYMLMYYPNKETKCIEILRIAYAKQDLNSIFKGIDAIMDDFKN